MRYSTAEDEERQHLASMRNKVVYASIGDVNPLIGWTLSERWTSPGYYAEAPRGEVTRKGSQDALFVAECHGEIDNG